jgi:NAD(P)-dependent dehydrogenase (short-subunit alcohol dehydrogenase family)
MREAHQVKKWILITGAGSGIGRASAELLAENGFMVYASDIKMDYVSDLGQNPNITAVKVDVTSQEDLQNLLPPFDETGLWGLVNNAGIALGGPLMELPMEELRKQFEVNFFSMHRVNQVVFPYILKQKGRIVIVSSNAGKFAQPFIGPYCSSKYAIEGYVDSLRRELMLLGVKVIKIKPGRTKTSIWDKGEHLIHKYENGLFGKSVKKAGRVLISEGKLKSLEPIHIAKIILKAFTAKHPKAKYSRVPNPFGIWARETFPDKFLDWVIQRKLMV